MLSSVAARGGRLHVACQSSHRDRKDHAPHVSKVLTKLAAKRRKLEDKRARQLAKIAKALDEVAREELSFLSREELVKDGDIDVQFGSSTDSADFADSFTSSADSFRTVK